MHFGSEITKSPVLGSFSSKRAVQERYNQTLFFRVLNGSLQGIAVRPLPCKLSRR